MPNIAKAVQFMIDTANNNQHGYDQAHRNGPDYDCSSLVATALYSADFAVSPYSWTGNLYAQLIACGFKPCAQPWKAGDVHLTPNKHTCMSIDAGRIVEASLNEKGTITGGAVGDQTGNEIAIKPYYENGWTYHLRFDDGVPCKSIEAVANEVIAGKWGNGNDRKTRLEAAGYNYTEVQNYVNYLLSPQSNVDLQKIAREVIKGNWGNGQDRKNRLIAAGYDYNDIQTLVNQMLA